MLQCSNFCPYNITKQEYRLWHTIPVIWSRCDFHFNYKVKLLRISFMGQDRSPAYSLFNWSLMQISHIRAPGSLLWDTAQPPDCQCPVYISKLKLVTRIHQKQKSSFSMIFILATIRKSNMTKNWNKAKCMLQKIISPCISFVCIHVVNITQTFKWCNSSLPLSAVFITQTQDSVIVSTKPSHTIVFKISTSNSVIIFVFCHPPPQQFSIVTCWHNSLVMETGYWMKLVLFTNWVCPLHSVIYNSYIFKSQPTQFIRFFSLLNVLLNQTKQSVK